MERVGVRELRQRASELLRRVAEGESIEITDRGRPVAMLTPLPVDPLERLRASGDLAANEGELADLPEPVRVTPVPVGQLMTARDATQERTRRRRKWLKKEISPQRKEYQKCRDV